MAHAKKLPPDHSGEPAGGSISMKALAEHLGLSTATISLVINRAPGAKAIPHVTQERIWAAAHKFKYRSNLMARSLRQKRSFTVGVMVPEISEGYSSMVLSGVEENLFQEGYFYFGVSHRHSKDLIEEYPHLLRQRAAEGIIAVDTVYSGNCEIPAVSISGHRHVKGVTNIVLDHNLGAHLALEHLHRLGHTRIVLIKGQDFSSDTETRWQAILSVARELGITIDEKLTIQLDSDSPSPEVGHRVTRKLLEAGPQFSALFAFNDISAMGAIKALRETGKPVPEDVSVIAWDHIQGAAFHNPSLTTVRQPIPQMGGCTPETLLST